MLFAVVSPPTAGPEGSPKTVFMSNGVDPVNTAFSSVSITICVP